MTLAVHDAWQPPGDIVCSSVRARRRWVAGKTAPRPSEDKRRTAMLTGSCLCGDIAFEIDGPVDMAVHCHCCSLPLLHVPQVSRQCVRDLRYCSASRLPVGAGSGAGQEIPVVRQGSRPFCPRCGSVVPAIGESLPVVLVPMGILTTRRGRRGLVLIRRSSVPARGMVKMYVLWHTRLRYLPCMRSRSTRGWESAESEPPEGGRECASSQRR